MNRILLAVAVAGLLASACTDAGTDSDCESLVGPEPWLILGPGDFGADCVEVGVHQDLQIWNKGTDPLSLEWQGTIIEIASDDNYATGPIGEVVRPGRYSTESDPYRSPDIHVVNPDDSISAETELDASRFGSIELGMTLEQASEASGLTVIVDPDLAPGPDCWQAIIAADPYSPIFTVAGDGTEDSTIEFITAFYPSDKAGTVGRATPAVPSLCS
ncbi:MAG TPA: hypothetical protein VFP42_06275 [Acidimicrobiia bacterium]|nr:hypothetical protein [Acidimicrobiia bacterium]